MLLSGSLEVIIIKDTVECILLSVMVPHHELLSEHVDPLVHQSDLLRLNEFALGSALFDRFLNFRFLSHPRGLLEA
jgi:hypothetical protein